MKIIKLLILLFTISITSVGCADTSLEKRQSFIIDSLTNENQRLQNEIDEMINLAKKNEEIAKQRVERNLHLVDSLRNLKK